MMIRVNKLLTAYVEKTGQKVQGYTEHMYKPKMIQDGWK